MGLIREIQRDTGTAVQRTEASAAFIEGEQASWSWQENPSKETSGQSRKCWSAPRGEILSQGLGATSQQIAAATEEESANLEEVSVQIAARRGHQKLLQEVPDIRQPPSRDEGWSPHRST